MQLHPAARKWYSLAVTTAPPIAPDAWEATFDGGTTWVGATVLDDDTTLSRWLVAGPTFDPASAPEATYTSLPLNRTTPRLRVVDAPEVLVEEAPAIDVQL